MLSVATAPNPGSNGLPPPARNDRVCPGQAEFSVADADPVLCSHCGRTARNGLPCQGICVADSGY